MAIVCYPKRSNDKEDCIRMENRRAGNLSVTTELPLALQFSAKLNMREDLAIKDALFQYLLSSEKII